MTNTPNKGYPLQATGTNVGTWGTVLNNGALSVIDNNLGGTLNISVAGNSNINLTASQASFLIHNLTGALTGNINYVFPALGGFFAVNNQTTGVHTVTITVVGGSGGIVVPQGQTVTIYIDATTPAVESLSGTQYQFIAGTVTGTANALIVAQTFPSTFSLNTGTLITFTPTANNTGSSTITIDGIGPITLQKLTFSGLSNLVVGDLIAGVPVIAQYTGSVLLALNITPIGYETTVSTNQSITFGSILTPFVNTAAITYTIAQTTTLLSFWYITINALGGNATITPNAADVINVNGASLAAGASYTLPRGAYAVITTDANGNLFISPSTFSLTALGAAKSGANSDITSLSAIGSNGISSSTGALELYNNTTIRCRNIAASGYVPVLCLGGTSSNQATTFDQFSNLLSASGYQKLPGGLIVQWKTGTNVPSLGGGASTTQAMTFPITFPTSVLKIIPFDQSLASTGFIYSPTSSTTSGFTMAIFNASSGSAQGTPAYVAIGY